jgi:hypothetical protein
VVTQGRPLSRANPGLSDGILSGFWTDAVLLFARRRVTSLRPALEAGSTRSMNPGFLVSCFNESHSRIPRADGTDATLPSNHFHPIIPP